MTATIQSVTRVGDRVQIQVTFSDNSLKAFDFDLPLVKAAARAEIKRELDRLNTIEGQVATLQSLVGEVLT